MRDIGKEFEVDPRVLAVDVTDAVQLKGSGMKTNSNAGYEFDVIGESDEEVNVDDI
jgi:hypothetical protein